VVLKFREIMLLKNSDGNVNVFTALELLFSTFIL